MTNFLFGGPPPVEVTGIVPRDYQIAGVETADKLLAGNLQRLLLVLATGGGKTVCAALVILRAYAKGLRCLFIAPRREIIAQAYWTFVRAGVPETDCGVVMADGRIPHAVTREAYDARRPLAHVQVASVQTLSRRALPKADVVFLDEAHHAISPTSRAIVQHYQDKGAKIVGLTATPCRGDGRGLGDVFDRLHVIASFADLAEQGHLVIPRVFTVAPPDLSQVATSKGDYDATQLAEAVDKRELVGNVVEHWLKWADGRTSVVFAASVEHSKHLTEAFCKAGVTADHVDCETPTDQRDAALGRLATGETQVLCNMGICTEGWDLPRCKCVVLARPTKSLGLYLQMAGRGLRPWQDTGAVLLDHAGAVLEHGFPQDSREWTLTGKVRKPKVGMSLKDCPRCFGSNPSTAVACTYCGFLFVGADSDQGKGLKEVDGELVEMTSGDLRKLPAGLRQLRQRIHLLAGNTDRRLRWEDGTTNVKVKRHFGKARGEMDYAELEAVLAWLDSRPWDARPARELVARFEVPRTEAVGWW